MEKSKSALWAKRITCILVIAVAVVALVLNVIVNAAAEEPKGSANAPDYSYDISMMQTTADYISTIESVGGKTLEEAYYQAYGLYLSEQANLIKSIAEDAGQSLQNINSNISASSQQISSASQMFFIMCCLACAIAILVSGYQLALTFIGQPRSKKQAPAAEEPIFSASQQA